MVAATIFLTLCLIFVGGWTDAPNALVGVVTGGALPYGKAVVLGATCNFLGVVISCIASSSVASTMTSLVSFGDDGRLAITALLCAIASVVIFAVAAWFFGIPTSESHGLIGALMGAAFAVNPSAGIDTDVALPVIFGLLLSIATGFASGFIAQRIMPKKLFGGDVMGKSSIGCAAVLSFLHGAQDGQKFIAVMVIAQVMAIGGAASGVVVFSAHMPSVLITAFVMALGTLLGGRRIIENVGHKMVTADMWDSVCSDTATIVNLLSFTAFGMPVSTTHAKTSSMLGCALGAGKGVQNKIVTGMVGTWFITLPACAVIAYFITNMAVALF